MVHGVRVHGKNRLKGTAQLRNFTSKSFDGMCVVSEIRGRGNLAPPPSACCYALTWAWGVSRQDVLGLGLALHWAEPDGPQSSPKIY